MLKQTTNLLSGAELTLQAPPFGVASKLFKTVARELLAVKIDITVNPSKLKDLLEREAPMNDLKNVLCGLAGSDAVEAALWECMRRCSYNGVAIEPTKTFEDEQAREDYLAAAWEVMRFSLLPFFKGLLFASSTLAPDAGSSQK